MTTSPSATTKKASGAAKRVPPRRDFAAMEMRRMRAADLFVRGVSQANIARASSAWPTRRSRTGTRNGWKEEGRRWKGCRTSRPAAQGERDELAKVEKVLPEDAKASGYADEFVWILQRRRARRLGG